MILVGAPPAEDMRKGRQIMRVRIRFSEITCVVGRDGPGKAEPFLWPTFFRIDADAMFDACNQALATVEVIDSLGWPVPFNAMELSLIQAVRDWSEPDRSDDPAGWLQLTQGHHGNIGEGMADGKTRAIPEDVGMKDLIVAVPSMDVLRERARVGFAIVLLEADGTSGMADHYQDNFGPGVKQAVRGAIVNAAIGRTETINIGGVELPLPLTPDQIASAKLASKLKAELRWAEDDFIGAAVRSFDFPSLAKVQGFEFRWNRKSGSEDGSFRVRGEVQLMEE